MIVTTGTSGKTTTTAATATGPATAANQRLAAVGRPTIRVRQEVDFVFIVGGYLDAKIVMSAPAHSAVITNELPVYAAIVLAPQLAAVGFLSIVWNAIASFDQRVDAFRIRACDCQSPFTSHARG